MAAVHRRTSPSKSISTEQTNNRSLWLQQEHKPYGPSRTTNSRCPSSLINHRHSSGESSNVENWFNDANKDVHSKRGVFIADDTSFHPQSASASASSSIQDHQIQHRGGALTLPLHHDIGDLRSTRALADDYRSVIDDLTIENQRLRRRMKRLKRARFQDTASDQLFEIQAHGLSPKTKRDLEETLHLFAMRRGESIPNNGATASVQEQTTPLAISKSGFSAAFTKLADSGYGSMAASHQPSSIQASSTQASTGQSSQKKRLTSAVEASKTRQKNIHSYLHDIPEGLFPQKSTVVTEQAQKQLVVKRLEQIFLGRGATAEGHQQPLQQQEVSQSAANADRSAVEAQGHTAVAEGMREAPIMESQSPNDDILNGSTPFEVYNQTELKQSIIVDHGKALIPLTSKYTEQRPTRPLDLDPQRAQIPADNINYIRHLGFAVPDGPADSEGTDDLYWIYLNLLINMAQLHLINVSTNFVQQAILEESTRLELSPDGRKVRWRNKSFHKTTTDIENSVKADRSQFSKHSQSFDKGTESLLAPKKQPTTDTRNEESKPGPQARERQDVYELPEPCGDACHGFSTSASNEYESQFAYPSVKSRGMRSQRPRMNCPMTFYKDARFFSDLSREKLKGHHATNSYSYIPITTCSLGTSKSSDPWESDIDNVRLPELAWEIGLRKRQENPIPSESYLKWSQTPNSIPTMPDHTSLLPHDSPQELQVSGISGIQPSDHFTVSVRREYVSTFQRGSSSSSSRDRSRFNNLLNRKVQPKRISSTIVDAELTSLKPSPVPAPHYATHGSQSDVSSSLLNVSVGSNSTSSLSPSSDAMGELSYSSSASKSSGVTSSSMTAAKRLRRLDTANVSISSIMVHEDGNDDGDLSEDDNQSLDLLATARAVDPTAVFDKEREYDAEIAERLAEEIPAGSSAATFGAGSGYNSPVTLMYLAANRQRGGNEALEGSVSS